MTFQVLIATIGRPSLQRMLDSLSPQLQEEDCLTLVFDGHSKIPEFNLKNFKCEIKQHFEVNALGSWGHSVRNKYASLLEKRDFVMHADDDDIYFPNVFDILRKQCIDKNTLYIARMSGSNGYIVPEGKFIKTGSIGTPNGIIPHELNMKGTWGTRFGGDGAFYEEIAKLTRVEYLDTLIYFIRAPMNNNFPKKVHQIWIGPKKRPDIWMESVKKFCSEKGYEYIVWDDKKVSEMSMINRDWYNLETTYNGKSDILRYEILYQNGGLYIDADMVVLDNDKLQSLITEFNKDSGFGFELDNKLICGAVTLAQRYSKFMSKCIEEVPKRDFKMLAWQSIGPQLITEMAMKYQREIPLAIYKSTVFYPRRWHGIQDIRMHETYPVPPESVMFQYGYSTNNLESKI
jgi:hypothetical protein